MISFRILATVAALAVQPGAAWADAPHAPRLKAATAVPIAAYGRQNPNCTEWTNGCVVCVAAEGHSHCSTAGIACTPAGLTCKRSVAP